MIILLALQPSFVLALDGPILGHRIGETIIDFLEREGGESHLGTCRIVANRRPSKRLSQDYKDCQELISAVDKGTRFQMRFDGGSERLTKGAREVATFERCQLVKMIIRIHAGQSISGLGPDKRITFQRIFRNLKSRFGDPQMPDSFANDMTLVTQPKERIAEWSLPNVHVSLCGFEFRDGEIQQIVISLWSADEYDRLTGHSTAQIDLLQ